jgi:hypothetical protein
MRLLATIASAAAVLASALCTSMAYADQMDPAIERLTMPAQVRTGPGVNDVLTINDGKCAPNGRFTGNPIVGGTKLDTAVIICRPNNTAFARLINQYGAAVAPTAMHSARTTGYGGFHLSIEGAYTSIDKDADYWHKGTQGPQDPNSHKFSTENKDPASLLQVYSLKVRKGFPFGLEVGAQVGFMSQTSMVTGGADVRMSLLEGFRKGALGIFPDIAAGGGVRTVTGTPQFNLTVASFDVQISKPLPLADSNILTPYVGFQYLWIFGDSGLIDTTPNTDPIGYCNYTGPNVPGNPSSDPKKSGVYDGQPVCNGGGSNQDFNSTFVFDNVRVTRQRLIVGMNYRYEIVWFGGQFMTDIVNPEDGGGRDNAKHLKGVPRQQSFVIEIGAMF